MFRAIKAHDRLTGHRKAKSSAPGRSSQKRRKKGYEFSRSMLQELLISCIPIAIVHALTHSDMKAVFEGNKVVEYEASESSKVVPHKVFSSIMGDRDEQLVLTRYRLDVLQIGFAFDYM